MKKVYVKWEPQWRQLVALKACGLSAPFGINAKLRPEAPKSQGEPFKPAIATHLGYGGAAGGGKTDMMVAGALVAMIAYPGINIGYFRRKFPQLQGLGGAIERSKIIFPLEGFTYHKTQHKWFADNGSQLAFCHCQNPDDVQNYQSQQFDILMLDETTQFTETMIKFLLTRNRATVDFPTFKPFALFSTNPGGVSHSYFKREFVDIGPFEKLHNYKNETGEIETHYFIPAKLTDNRILMKRDPDYVVKLSPNIKIRQRLLEGNWEAVQGAEFHEFRRSTHVLEKTIIPKNKIIYLGIDWGYSGKDYHKGAFAATLMAVIRMSSKDDRGDDHGFNRIVVFREYYGKRKSPEEWAKIIHDTCEYDKITIKKVVCDPSMFDPEKDGSSSISKKMEAKFSQLSGGRWTRFERGTKNRIARCANLHDWLRIAPDGLPYIMFTHDCKHLIRTLPELMTDENNDRDVDTEGEDHLYDCLTYALNQIKFISAKLGAFGTTPKKPHYEIAPMADEEGKVKITIDVDKFGTEPPARQRNDWDV